MKDLWAILKYEARQSLTKTIVTVLILILVAGLAFIQYHTLEYRDLKAQKEIFQEIEKNVIDSYPTVRHYATYGFRVMFQPSPISILFANSTVLQDMWANIETGFRLSIYQSLKNRTIFGLYKYLFADFSGIFLFFVGLIAVFYGFIAFRNQEYLKTQVSIAGTKNLFIKILLARAILLALYSLLFLALAVLVVAINGESIAIDQHLALFYLQMCAVTLFFLVLGAVFGSCKSIFWGLGGIISSWFLLLFIVPFLVGVIVYATSASIKPESRLELEKLKLMMGFEKRFSDETGVVPLNKTVTDIQKDLVNGYYNNEFQLTQKLEEQVRVQMQGCIRLSHFLYAFFPTTFYQSFTNEISGMGYKTLENFYKTIIQIKDAFLKEYMKKLFLSPQPANVEPFLKGDENIFVGKSTLPGYLLLGFIFNLAWIIGLAVITYYGFKKRLGELPEKLQEESGVNDVHLKKIDIRGWRVYSTKLSGQLYNLLSNNLSDMNKKGYSLKVSIEGQLLNTAKKAQNFLYLGQFSKFPGHLKTGWVIDLLMGLMHVDNAKQKEIKSQFSLDDIKNKKINRLETSEIGRIYLAILEMKKFHIYLIDDITSQMYLDFCITLRDKCLALFDTGSIILLISSEDNFLSKEKECMPSDKESRGWFRQIGNRKIQEEKKHCLDDDDDSEEIIEGDPDEEE